MAQHPPTNPLSLSIRQYFEILHPVGVPFQIPGFRVARYLATVGICTYEFDTDFTASEQVIFEFNLMPRTTRQHCTLEGTIMQVEREVALTKTATRFQGRITYHSGPEKEARPAVCVVAPLRSTVESPSAVAFTPRALPRERRGGVEEHRLARAGLAYQPDRVSPRAFLAAAPRPVCRPHGI